MMGLSGNPLGGGLSPVWPGPGTNGEVLGTTAGDVAADELLGGAEEVLSGADELLGGTDVELSGADELLGGADDLLGGADDVLGGTEALVDGGVGVEEGQDTQNTLCLAAPFSPVKFQKSL
jgi:large repetitive protein